MTATLERAARALCAEELLLSVHEVNEIWNDLPETKRAAVLNRARAVLLAVREPDDAMFEAWSNAEEANDHPAEYHLNQRRYAAMIDAILADGEGR